MMAVHRVEVRSDQNNLKMKPGFFQCNNISKHGAWLTGELEEDIDSARHLLVFGSMRASREPIDCS
jgi:hypothetical protein